MFGEKNKANILAFYFMLFSYGLFSQQIYAGFGFSDARFSDYKNNMGLNSLDNSGYVKPKTFQVESGFLYNIYREVINADIGVSFNNYKINTSFYREDKRRVPLTYELSYVSIKAGFNFDAIQYRDFKIKMHTHLSHDWFVYGNSKYDDVQNNLYTNSSLDKTLIRLHGGLGLEYRTSRTSTIYMNYDYGRSFKEKNNDSSSGEEYYFVTNAVKLGMLFDVYL